MVTVDVGMTEAVRAQVFVRDVVVTSEVVMTDVVVTAGNVVVTAGDVVVAAGDVVVRTEVIVGDVVVMSKVLVTSDVVVRSGEDGSLEDGLLEDVTVVRSKEINLSTRAVQSQRVQHLARINWYVR